MDAEPRSINRSMVLSGGIMLLGAGILWGWVWFTLVHTIPFFYLISPVVDVAAYGFVGTRVNRGRSAATR